MSGSSIAEPAGLDEGAAGINRHLVRAAEYRAIAAGSMTAAEASELPRVREKLLRSAQVWTAMAEADEHRARPPVALK